MEKVFLDMLDVKKKSEVQDRVQEDFFTALRAFLEERYTRVEQVGNSDLAVVIGAARDEDGFAQDVCMVVHGTCKHWYDGVRKCKDGTKVTPKYDIEEEAMLYEQAPETIKRRKRLAARKEKQEQEKQIDKVNKKLAEKSGRKISDL